MARYQLTAADHTYAADWKAARERSSRFGLDVPKCPPLSWQDAVSAAVMRDLEAVQYKIVDEMLGGSPQGLNNQCHTICLEFANLARRVKATPTFGNLYIKNGPKFWQNVEVLECALEQGVPAAAEGMEMHTWLTLPSGQIVDPTLMTTIAGNPDFAGQMLIQFPGGAASLFRFEPLFVGPDIYKRLGMLRGEIARWW